MCLEKMKGKLVYNKFFHIVRFSSYSSLAITSFIEGLNIFFSRRNSQPSFVRHPCYSSSRPFLILEFSVFTTFRVQTHVFVSAVLFLTSYSLFVGYRFLLLASTLSLLFHEERIQIASVAIRFLSNSLSRQSRFMLCSSRLNLHLNKCNHSYRSLSYFNQTLLQHNLYILRLPHRDILHQ